ncbi:MAG: NUDIX hydrolase [Leucobacter sp.]
MTHYGSASVTERRTLPPAVAVSTVAFALRPPSGAAVRAEGDAADARAQLWIPLVRRTRAPYRGSWALPGGPTEWHETLSDTALRTLHDAALRAPGYLEQLYAFGGVERSAEAQRLVTIAYWALFGERDLAAEPSVAAGARSRIEAAGVSAPRRWDDPRPATRGDSGGAEAAGRGGRVDPEPDASSAENASAENTGAENASGGTVPDPNVAWFAVDALPDLAFDHADIIGYARHRLRAKTEYAAVAHRFLGPTFTLARLRAVHEAVRGGAVDPANFRRQVLGQGNLIDTGARETGTRHRPARLYRFRDDSGEAGLIGDAEYPESSAA